MTFEVSKNLEGLYCYAASPEAAVDLVQRPETQDSGERSYLATSVFREAYLTKYISKPSRFQKPQRINSNPLFLEIRKIGFQRDVGFLSNGPGRYSN